VTAVPQRRIRNAAELLAAVADPDPAVRVAVLQAVACEPERVLAYGAHAGRDVIDALLEQAAGPERRGLWEVVVATLAAFRDPRVVEFFKGLLSRSRRAPTLFNAAARLELEPVASLREFLRPLLMQNESDARARAAARLLVAAPDLDPAARLRAALLAGRRGVEPPLLTADPAAAWRAELAGLFGPLARRALEAQGKPAFLVLESHWEQLAEGDQIWALRWGVTRGTEAAALLAKALRSGSTAVVRAALQCLPALGEGPASLAPALAALATGPDPTLRRAAIQAGAGGLDFRSMLAAEPGSAVRRASLIALARQEGRAALPDLLAALRDEDWGVRATATQALAALGEEVAAAIEPLIRDPDPRIRTTAIQVLIRVGREAWLEEELLV
jgi:HEAT repeat protein